MPILKMSCKLCGKEYVGGIFPSRIRKYCSSICSHKSLRIKRSIVKCITCFKKFEILPSQSAGKFCSVSCIRYQGNTERLKTRKSRGFWQVATQEEKFNKIKKEYERLVIKKDGCWSWLNKSLRSGYGKIHIGRKKMILAHRVSWMIHNGPIPDNKWVLHHCDNPICSNPEHLFLGTPSDNVKDMLRKNRRNNCRQFSKRARLTPESAKEIKQLILQKVSQSAIAKKFNVSPSTIQGVADGRTWKNIAVERL